MGYSEAWIRTLAVGAALFVLYLCLRSLGLNTVSAYQRAKVSALKIVNLGMRRSNNTTRKEVQEELRKEKAQSEEGLPNPSPIIKQKVKYSKKSINQDSS